MCRWLFLFFAIFVYQWPIASASEVVDLELVLLSDASGSIDAAEIAFQREGYASAITDPAVLKAMTGGWNGKVAITFVEWGDALHQDVVEKWPKVGDGVIRRLLFRA